MAWPGRSLELVLKRWVEKHPVARTPHRPFEYEPLEGDHNETVRLMILFPAASYNDHLVCYLFERSFVDFSHEALSYAWGNIRENKPIYCAMPEENHYGKLEITKNLDEALRALRRKSRLRSLWVDALCINQQDADEKLRQISLMAQIFSKASQTIIWLGKDDAHTARLFKTYRRHHYIKKISSAAANSYLTKFDEDDVEKYENIIQADRDIRSRPWFYRLWTLQELLFGSDPLVICGSQTIQWTCIAETDSMNEFRGELPKRSNCSTSFATLSKSAPRRYEPYAGYYHDILMNIKQLQSTEPRDKVIGTTAVLSSIGIQLPYIDYSTSVQDIFVAATRSWLRHTDSLRLMYLAVTGQTTPGLPSWAIDWDHSSIKDRDMFMYWMNRRRDDQPQVVPPHSGTERDRKSYSAFDYHFGVQGVLVDKVSALVAGAVPNASDPQMGYTMIRWLDFLTSVSTPPTLPSAVQQAVALFPIESEGFDADFPSGIVEAVILHKASLIDRSIAAEPYNEKKHSKIKHNAVFFPDEAMKVPIRGPRDVLNPMYQLELKMKNETMFVSESGQLGFCFCEQLQEGDAIAMLAGADYPVVLREAGEPGQYYFVGPATVYGMMDGELWPKNADELGDIILV